MKKSDAAFPLPRRRLRVLVLQNSAGPDRLRNLRRLETMLARAPAADVVVLPEVFAFRGSDDDYCAGAEPLRRSAALRWLSETAASLKCWVLGGSVPERRGGRIFNASALFDRSGALRACYRKMHLFEALLPGGRRISEHAVFSPGRRPALADIEGWRCGLAICYDLRFPELFRCYALAGAHLFFVVANFTQRTGMAHWETLLRARAIENQCFVVAADQCGANPRTGVESYGHSMAFGPWGERLAGAGGRESFFCVDLQPRLLRQTRGRIPVLEHVRLRRLHAP